MGAYLARINWVDLLILILLLRTSYVGFIRGLSYEILTLLGIIGSAFLAIHNYKHIGNFFIDYLSLPVEFSNFLSFLIIAVGAIFVFKFIRDFFCKFARLEILPALEKYGGVISGFVRGCMLSSLILLVLLLIPNEYIKDSIQNKSLGGVIFLKIAPACYEYSVGLFPRFREAGKNRIIEELLTHEPSDQKVKEHIKKRTKK